jgi:hypothetical protein
MSAFYVLIEHIIVIDIGNTAIEKLATEFADLKTELTAEYTDLKTGLAFVTALLEVKQKAKQGSQLSKTELHALNFFDGCFFISNVANLTDPLYNVINALVSSYLSTAVDNLNNGRVDEVKYVQPESLQLLKNIIDHLNTTRVDKLTVYDKTSGSPFIYYDTAINVKGQAVKVSGETNATVCYRNIPVFVWEDKNLNKFCDTAAEQGQILVEIKGNAEKFKEIITLPPYCVLWYSDICPCVESRCPCV